VVLQGESTQNEKDVAAPLGVVGGLKIKSDGNQILDVLDGGGLAVQVSDGCGFGGDGVVVAVIVDFSISSAKALAEGGSLLLQGISGRALRIEGGSGHTDPFLGGGGGLQKGSLLLGCALRSELEARREAASSSRAWAAASASSRRAVAEEAVPLA
jgi:hypothetical protein